LLSFSEATYRDFTQPRFRCLGLISKKFGRYIEEAQLIGRPVPVVETATAVMFKLPPSPVDAVRARAAAEGTMSPSRIDPS
jgi:hypothetical protein